MLCVPLFFLVEKAFDGSSLARVEFVGLVWHYRGILSGGWVGANDSWCGEGMSEGHRGKAE